MTILNRYVTQEFLRLFGMIVLSLLLLALMVDFFGKIRYFMSNHAPIRLVAAHFFYMIPMIVAQTIPAAVLLATLMTFGTMSRHSEITAIKAGGVSLYRLARPVILLAVVIGVAAFFISEWIMPYTNMRAETIRLVEVPKKHNMPAFKQDQIWYRGKDGVYNFKFFEPRTNTLRGISIYYLTTDFRLTRRIDAEKAEWKDGAWVFTKLLITRFDQGGFPSLEWVPKRVVSIPEKPEDFKIVQKDTEQMGFFDLRDYVRKLRSEGYDATRYVVDMHGKVAFSLITVILVFIGISFSLREERGGGVSRSIGTAIVIGFSYWLVHAFSLSLGRAGTLPPLLAAWMANILFLAAAAFMYSRIRT